MAERFVVSELAAPLDPQRSVLTLDRTKVVTVWAGLFGTERLGLLFQQGAESALRQPCRGGRGDLLHGLEVEVQSGTRLPASTTGHDFAPLGSQFTDFLELLGRDFGT